MAVASGAPDIKGFWQAIGQRATGSTIVTARGVDGPAGFLGLSATHLSADPPLMLVSIDRRTSALAAVLASRHFAINWLGADDAALAEDFGGRGPAKGADRFAPGRWTTLVTGAPVLLGGAGAVDCTLEETIERGGTVIVIGRVAGVATGTAEPLVHFRGGYRLLAPA